MLSNITDNCTITYLVQPDPGCVKDTPTDQIVVMILIILLVIYTFHRLYYVWVNTLNFSEVGCNHAFYNTIQYFYRLVYRGLLGGIYWCAWSERGSSQARRKRR